MRCGVGSRHLFAPKDEHNLPTLKLGYEMTRKSKEPGQKVETPSLQPKSPFSQTMDAINSGDDDSVTRLISDQLISLMPAEISGKYNVLYLYDDASIADYHADRLYAAASKVAGNKKPFLLIVHSPGGQIEPAYIISKALKRLSEDNLIVAVPRRAKSAATLISLGASEIHMGIMSQLGPIDPQYGGLPALALSNALDVIANVACRFPGSTEMLSKYLVGQIPIRHLGYFERINESAVQYAERLLGSRKFPTGETSQSIAQHLVNHYKDHNFVIDADEAKRILGDSIVFEGSVEYNYSDTVFQTIDLFSFFIENMQKRLFVVGGLPEAITIWSKTPSSGGDPGTAVSR